MLGDRPASAPSGATAASNLSGEAFWQHKRLRYAARYHGSRDASVRLGGPTREVASAPRSTEERKPLVSVEITADDTAKAS